MDSAPRKVESYSAAKRKRKSTGDIANSMESLISELNEPLQDKEKTNNPSEMDDYTKYVIVAEDQLSSCDLNLSSRKSFEATFMSIQARRSQSCEKCLADMEIEFIAEACIVDEEGKHWAKDVTFLVERVPIFGDRKYLAEISPVFDRMLNGKFAEAKQQEIELKDIKPDSFKDFLMAVWKTPIMPTSANVLELLELADRFDIASLRDNCGYHLKVSTEMPIIDRLILSQNYSLENLQKFLVNQITAKVWLQWQRSENLLEKIDLLNVITVTKITTNLAQELDKRDTAANLETVRRSMRPIPKSWPNPFDKKRF
ncbi:BTB/POZ domain-containing protein [Ditylenchus destructor]|nr:BTB/POZ domain-containing protein [Ditylenchus destructor]